eukprot:TRINITY_DN8755_c0_g1_i1.p1 TRINITY_DN8755_c0_g1~~TRINITY_DN8755_c0_g1_i1.p1  ORF type:complete len:859 (-),score=262.11 TRINITY_DN8755_c0_g1_i1:5-2581(-)
MPPKGKAVVKGKQQGGKKGTQVKVQKKQAAKQTVKRAKEKRERLKKRKASAHAPKEETIAEKLERFERENEERPAKRRKTEEELDVTTEDVDFFNEYGGGVMSFVENLDSNLGQESKLGKKKPTKKDKKAAKNKEEEWEKTRIIPSWLDTTSKLPVKKTDGTILEASVIPRTKKQLEAEEEEEDEDEDSGSEGSQESMDDESGEDDNLGYHNEDYEAGEEEDEEMLKLRLYHERQKKIAIIKEQVATLAHEVLGDPEGKVKRMGELRRLCESESDEYTKKLVVLSELNLFKDILPGYKIRLIETDDNTMISKEVAQVRVFEEALLKHYTKYVAYLESIVKAATKQQLGDNKQQNSLLVVCVRCLGELLVNLPHFNLRANVIEALIPMANASSLKISEVAISAIQKLFRDDRNSDASMETVKKISNYIKAKSHQVKHELVDTFLCLPLTAELPEGWNLVTGDAPKNKKKQAHMTRKQRKENKIAKEVEKELKLAEAEESREQRRYLQTETLKCVFLTYFRIIRKKGPESKILLPFILKGLAKFSHLINIDLLFDMLDMVKGMIMDNTTPFDDKLLCALTAFRTLKLQGQSLNVDLKEFYTSLYSILFQVVFVASTDGEILSHILECFDLMFAMKKELVMDRVAAFVKRMMIMCLYIPAHAAIAVMSIINTLMERYPKVQTIIGNDFAGTGTYHLELDDPEHCNPFAATLWEFTLINKHVNPVLKHLSTLVCKQKEVAGNYTPQQLFAFYSPNDKAVILRRFSGLPMPSGPSYIHPEMPAPPPHPLEKNLQKLQKQKDKKVNVNKAWFITPPHVLEEGTPFLKNLQKQAAADKTMEVDQVNSLLEEYWEESLNSCAVITD